MRPGNLDCRDVLVTETDHMGMLQVRAIVYATNDSWAWERHRPADRAFCRALAFSDPFQQMALTLGNARAQKLPIPLDWAARYCYGI